MTHFFNFMQFYLHISEIFSTFAPDFVCFRKIMEQITKEQIAEYRKQCTVELRHFYETMAVPSPINDKEREHFVSLISNKEIISYLEHNESPKNVIERILYYDFMTPGTN